jgi:hypothetical protein
MVFLGLRANAELVHKFYVALHASHAALPMVTLKILPYTNLTLTLGWITPTPRRKEVIVKQRKLKSGHPGTKTNWPIDRRSQYNLNLNLCHCTANYRPVLSSEGVPYMKKKIIITQRNVISGHLLQKGMTPRRTT